MIKNSFFFKCTLRKKGGLKKTKPGVSLFQGSRRVCRPSGWTKQQKKQEQHIQTETVASE